MKRLMIVFAVLLILSGSLFAQDNKFIEELKEWDFSIGGWAYLFEAEIMGAVEEWRNDCINTWR